MIVTMVQLTKHTCRINAISIAMLMLMTAMFAMPVYAQSKSEPTSIHKDWEAHVHGKGSQKQCFITSIPKQLKGEYDRNNRGQTRIYVTHRNSSRNEISTYAGYRYRDQSEVIFNIDGK